MKTLFEFEVRGEPIPQGSTKAFSWIDKASGKPRAAVTSDNPRMKDWRTDIRRGAQLVVPTGYIPTRAPIALTLLFVVPRPQSKSRRVAFPTVRPDLDKLLRAFKDALTSVVWADDSQVVGFRDVWKIYADDVAPGVRVRISIVESTDVPSWELLMGREQIFRTRGLFAMEG